MRNFKLRPKNPTRTQNELLSKQHVQMKERITLPIYFLYPNLPEMCQHHLSWDLTATGKTRFAFQRTASYSLHLAELLNFFSSLEESRRSQGIILTAAEVNTTISTPQSQRTAIVVGIRNREEKERTQKCSHKTTLCIITCTAICTDF